VLVLVIPLPESGFHPSKMPSDLELLRKIIALDKSQNISIIIERLVNKIQKMVLYDRS